MSRESDRFSYPSQMRVYYSDSSAIAPHVMLMVLNWMLLYNTDGAERQSHTHTHTPPPLPPLPSSTDKQCNIFWFFSHVSLPCGIKRHKVDKQKVNRIQAVWRYVNVTWLFIGVPVRAVAVLGFQASFTACGSMCRPFLCQQCHVFLWQGQRDTNCTTICVIQYKQKRLCSITLWNILCNRFFCRSDEQIIPCTIFLTGDYIPSRWHHAVWWSCRTPLASSVTILKLMSVQYTPIW